jgi:SAM-dependent methyltransferase
VRAVSGWPVPRRALVSSDVQQDDESDASYHSEGVDQLETIWGDGFLSPGGAGEVDRIVAGIGVADADVVDIGCGTGGAALVLAIEHAARSVTGVDVEPYVVSRATARARENGQAERVRFVAIEPGPLPFPDASFDVVFSKDAIIHVQDKEALYAEALRVLRSGGRLCVGDWLRGEGSELDPLVERFVAGSREQFYMQSLADLSQVASTVGFSDVEVEDRGDWYAKEAHTELANLRGPLRDPYLSRFGQEFYDRTIVFWERVVEATQRGVLRPGHLRARKL